MRDFNFEAYCDIVKHTAPKGLWVIEGFAATSDLDSQNDIIAQSALDMGAKSLSEYNTVLYNHDSDRPIGTVLEAKSIEGHLFVKVSISKTEPEIWEKVKDGTLSKFSIRGRVTDHEIFSDQLTGKEIFMIKGMELFEVSLVAVPANVHAKALSWYIEKAIREDVDKGKTYRQPGESLADCVKRKVKINIEEGMDQAQAVAAAYAMCGAKKDMDENLEYKGVFVKFIEAFKEFINKEEKTESTEKGGEIVLEKTDVKTEEKTEISKSEEPKSEVKKEEPKEEHVTLDVGAVRDLISQLQQIAKDVMSQSDAVKKSLEDVAKAKEDITTAKNDMVKMIADLNSVVKEIPMRKAQAPEEVKKEDRQSESEFEALTKTDAYQKARPEDKLFTLFSKLQEKVN
jgi:HK97 family phage prohead protease